ncbi:hypothetical protein CDAR_548711 [Caerostris darwini]|uniref:Uncharacterized protein n=1 Tax=Caerostris darwini TaxID=1538125 RepID=A0AAV4WI22_9ARAC|nr:hypothetical protein CDAR_548711 [Caerostris darwini]
MLDCLIHVLRQYFAMFLTFLRPKSFLPQGLLSPFPVSCAFGLAELHILTIPLREPSGRSGYEPSSAGSKTNVPAIKLLCVSCKRLTP